MFLDAAGFVFQRIVIGQGARGAITIKVETPRVVAHRRGFRVQSKVNGAPQDCLRPLRGNLPRRCHTFGHKLAEHHNVKRMRPMDSAH